MNIKLNETIEKAASDLSSRANFGPLEYYYEDFSISNRRKRARLISVPSPKLKTLQQNLLLIGIREIPTHFRATAYRRGCSIAANARRHAGMPYLFKTDIVDFFPSVRLDGLADLLCSAIPAVHASNTQNLLDVLTLRHGLAQGAPTSPHLSNVFMRDFDRHISKAAHDTGVNYTRYADDISVSSSDLSSVLVISELIFEHLSAMKLVT